MIASVPAASRHTATAAMVPPGELAALNTRALNDLSSKAFTALTQRSGASRNGQSTVPAVLTTAGPTVAATRRAEKKMKEAKAASLGLVSVGESSGSDQSASLCGFV